LLLAAPAILIFASIGCFKSEPTVIVIDSPEPTANQRAADKAIAFLLAHQQDDGAWRSDVYGHFRAGDALTPLALNSLLYASTDPNVLAAVEKGLVFMDRFVTAEGVIDPTALLNYPVYTASLMVKILADSRCRSRTQAFDAWVGLLLDWQMTEENGWSLDDWQYGGWGYATSPPRKPKEKPLPAVLEANLSATAYAVEALRIAGFTARIRFENASVFIDRCQNYATEDPDLDFDDGGFFFTPGDPFRNKAGQVRIKSAKVRHRSYGSATVDGLRCQIACAVYHLPDAVDRRTAATRWLEKGLTDFANIEHPGNFAPERELDRKAGYFYYTSHICPLLRNTTMAARADAIRDQLVRIQNEDGSWKNEHKTLREDDPIVATAFALRALKQ